MKIDVRSGLAAMLYYQSADYEKGTAFDAAPKEKQSLFLAMADSVLLGIDKLNLTVVPAQTKSLEEAEAVLRNKIEGEISAFAGGLHKSHKPGSIPWEDLQARLFNMWRSI
jgi:hypothetical protein